MAHRESVSHIQSMKGLQQGINIKDWPGNGEPAKAWGKMKQDPELWDEKGDSLIFFSRSRTEPSFRIQSSLLRETGSDTLVDMLLYGTVRAYGNNRGISHKIYLDPPSCIKEKLDIMRHHITTRNFFAFLQRKSLVGFTFYQALVDLHQRLEEYLAPGTDCTAAMKSYLVSIGLVNVSNEPRAAAGLLAWSEDVNWDEGWREAFVHSVGMFEQLSRLQECADISIPTRAHLDRKHLELQVRIQEVQDSLEKWYFDDAHFAVEDEPPSVKQASARFCKFLGTRYQKEYQSWPSKKGPEAGNLWLNRRITLRLQEDFGALYEYLVDRKVTWNAQDESEEMNTRRNKASLKSESAHFWLDVDDERMLGVFRNLDCRLNAQDNIPYPYPILPTTVPPPASAAKRKGFFSKEKKKDFVRESRVAHAYSEATNASQLGRAYALNTLTRAFIRFEKADQPDIIDPREARRERWTIIYCILSTLAGISVDTPNLTFKNVDYFLNTRLDGLPPWCPEENVFLEASREQSHCWISPLTWAGDTYKQKAVNSGAGGSVAHQSGTGETSYNRRPLSPNSDGSPYAFMLKPPGSPSPSLQGFVKYVGTKPAQFSYFDSSPRDLIASPTSQPQSPSTEKGSSARPSNDIHNPSSSSTPSLPELGSRDSFSDYGSAPSLTEASSAGRGSSTDRSSNKTIHQRILPIKFAKLPGIDEFGPRPLSLRFRAKKASKGEQDVVMAIE